MKNKWLATCLVPAFVNYCLCTTEEMYLNKTKSLKSINPDPFCPDGSMATVHFFRGIDDENNGVISAVVTIDTKIGKDKIEMYASLIHEATHIWQETKKFLGEKEPSKEFEAISLATICEDLMREFDRQTKTT